MNIVGFGIWYRNAVVSLRVRCESFMNTKGPLKYIRTQWRSNSIRRQWYDITNRRRRCLTMLWTHRTWCWRRSVTCCRLTHTLVSPCSARPGTWWRHSTSWCPVNSLVMYKWGVFRNKWQTLYCINDTRGGARQNEHSRVLFTVFTCYSTCCHMPIPSTLSKCPKSVFKHRLIQEITNMLTSARTCRICVAGDVQRSWCVE